MSNIFDCFNGFTSWSEVILWFLFAVQAGSLCIALWENTSGYVKQETWNREEQVLPFQRLWRYMLRDYVKKERKKVISMSHVISRDPGGSVWAQIQVSCVHSGLKQNRLPRDTHQSRSKRKDPVKTPVSYSRRCKYIGLNSIKYLWKQKQKLVPEAPKNCISCHICNSCSNTVCVFNITGGETGYCCYTLCSNCMIFFLVLIASTVNS